jgi:Phage integrase, N-terminal SAM-like domain
VKASRSGNGSRLSSSVSAGSPRSIERVSPCTAEHILHMGPHGRCCSQGRTTQTEEDAWLRHEASGDGGHGELQERFRDDSYVPPSRMTLGRYLEDEWLPAVRKDVRGGTFDAYQLHVKSHIVPRLGDVLLQPLSRGQIKKLFPELRQSGRKRGGGPLSRRRCTTSTSHSARL